MSHSGGEKELATLFKEALTRDFLGLVNIFVSSDGSSIEPGEVWMDTVITNLRSAKIFIILCSQDSVSRRWINIEIGAALARGKPIIPICHTDLTASMLKRPLQDHQAIDASQADGLKNLYERIARQLRLTHTPYVNFSELASRVRRVEDRLREDKAQIDRAREQSAAQFASDTSFRNPDVLCATSRQVQEAIGRYLDSIRAAFPNRVRHLESASSRQLCDLLAEAHFDIVHVATHLCPSTGDLVFSSVDTQTLRHVCASPDTLPADTFVRLINESGASLVVIPNNESLPLVAKLLPVTSVVFAKEPFDIETLAGWMREFYDLLSRGYRLSEACRKASVKQQAPMELYPRLVRHFPAMAMPLAQGL